MSGTWDDSLLEDNQYPATYSTTGTSPQYPVMHVTMENGNVEYRYMTLKDEAIRTIKEQPFFKGE